MLPSVPNKLHSTCFAGSVLLGAVLSKWAPPPTLAGHLGRLVETHVEDDGDCKPKPLTPIRRPFLFACGKRCLATEAVLGDNAVDEFEVGWWVCS